MLYALGLDDEEILAHFYKHIPIKESKRGWKMPFVAEKLRGVTPQSDLADAKTGEVIARAGREDHGAQARARSRRAASRKCWSRRKISPVAIIAEDIVDLETGKIFAEAGDELDAEAAGRAEGTEGQGIPILDIDHVNVGAFIRNTLNIDKNANQQEALMDIYRVMRPGEPPTIEAATALFQGLFFDPERYDLSAVGRVKMNMRLELDAPDTMRVLRREDILAVVKTLVDLRDGKGEIDDIDHLGNRRVRSVGELMENQYRVGLLRMERAIKERMSSVEIDTVMPQDLINAKPAAAAVREFFGSSQLSQFMDQTNPLSEITHKRRLSALGPGGLDARACRLRGARRASDALRPHLPDRDAGRSEHRPHQLARDVRARQQVRLHREPVSQGRELPGDGRGRLPLRNGGNAPPRRPGERRSIDAKGQAHRRSRYRAVINGDVMLVPTDKVDYIDVSPKQLVSVAAALIPFLENDDANRALMGSNMQRQAVPLIKAEAPLVGTGMEERVAQNSGAAIAARRTGIVDQVDATRIVIRATEEQDPSKPGVDIYRLRKFQRSNQNTCINQRPLINVGDIVQRRRHHRRRSVDGPRRTGARQERARRVHAVDGLQLRRLRS